MARALAATMAAVPSVPADPLVLEELRAVLASHGYSDDGLRAALGGTPGFGLPAFDPVSVAQRLPEGDLRDLVALFLLGDSIGHDAALRLLGGHCCEGLQQAGLLEVTRDAVRAGVAIHVWGDLVLACDRLDSAARPDHVVGMTPAAQTLAHLTIRPAGGRALDVGTGCGVEALIAAQHSASVAATDANPRALGLAAINARLNGVDGLELAVGNWYEPVAGRQFELIVANPPFVVSPDSALLYRDGDEPGDGVSRHVLAEAAAHLAPGGFATVLCNWIRRADDEPEPPVAWLAASGCDGIVLRYGLDDPVAYAASWNHALRVADPAGFEAALARWLSHYDELGVRAIASGAVVLRRAGGPGRMTVLQALEAPTGPADEQLRRIFAGQELLAGDDDALLATRPRVVEGQAIEQTLCWTAGAYAPGPGLAVLEPGAGLAVEIEPGVAELLSRCDGRAALRDLAPDRDPAVLRAVRELLSRGFLDLW